MPERQELERMADVTAAKHGIPPGLFKGLIKHESAGWKVRAIRQEPAFRWNDGSGRVGDASRGLTQILLSTALDMGYAGDAEGLFDPATNLEMGARYLSKQYQRFKGWPAALAAYNGGPGAGTPVTRPTTTVLARDQRTGQPVRSFTAQPGQFRNQPYVDVVLEAAQSYGFGPTSGFAMTGLLLIIGIILAIIRASR